MVSLENVTSDESDEMVELFSGEFMISAEILGISADEIVEDGSHKIVSAKLVFEKDGKIKALTNTMVPRQGIYGEWVVFDENFDPKKVDEILSRFEIEYRKDIKEYQEELGKLEKWDVDVGDFYESHLENFNDKLKKVLRARSTIDKILATKD